MSVTKACAARTAKSGRHRPFYVIGRAVLAVLLGLSVSASAAGSDSERRIQRIQNGLLHKYAPA